MSGDYSMYTGPIYIYISIRPPCFIYKQLEMVRPGARTYCRKGLLWRVFT